MELYWGWLSLGAICIIVEILSPTFFFLWPGLAAIVVAASAWIIPAIGFNARLALFGILTAAFAFVWHRYLKKNPTRSDDPLLNLRGQQLIGNQGVVCEPIQNGRGRIKIGDSTWSAQGVDCEVGAAVKVTAVNGSVLQVEKLAE